MKKKSLQKQLSRTLIASLALLGIVGNSIVYYYVKKLDLHEFDQELFEEMEVLAAMTVITPAGLVEAEFHPFDFPEYRRSPNAEYYQLWTSDKELLVRSPSLQGSAFPFVDVELNKSIIRDTPLPDGRNGRAIWAARAIRKVQPVGHSSGLVEEKSVDIVYLVLARSRESMDRILRLEVAFAVIIGALMTACALLIVNRLTAHAFGKVDKLSKSMEEISMDTLANRVPESELPRELQPIAARFNDLISRLEKGVERERRFSADIAHELRTPVTALRSLHELAVEECRDGTLGDPGAYSTDALQLTDRMHRLIETLSQLHDSSMERGLAAIDRADIRSIITTAWKECEEEADRRGLTWTFTCANDMGVATNPASAHALLYNLLDNAVTYSPDHSSVECEVTDRGREVSVVIKNIPTPKLDESDLGHMAEAFWQKDPSRADTNHVGLGLSLVLDYARRLNVDVAFQLSGDGYLEVRALFPADGRLNK